MPDARQSLTLNVVLAGSATTVATTRTVFGEPATISATVAPIGASSDVPSGAVVFEIDGVAIGSPVPLSGGKASLTTSSLGVAVHAVTARYTSDDGIFSDSAGSGTQTVSAATSATAVASTPNPSIFGRSVTFTATVTAVAPGAGAPDGTVQFAVDGIAVGSPVTLSSGTAAFSTTALAVGTRSITATYGGSLSFIGSTGATSQVVRSVDTTTILTSSANPATIGQPVTLTATVTSPSGTPTGAVTFFDGATPLGAAVTLNASGVATLTTASLTLGTHSLSAGYASADGSFNASTGTLSQVVRKIATTTTVTGAPNPAALNETVRLNVTVTGAIGTPSGTVQLFDGTTPLGGVLTLDATGRASLSLTSLAVGSHSITATYGGAATYDVSTSAAVTQVVLTAAQLVGDLEVYIRTSNLPGADRLIARLESVRRDLARGAIDEACATLDSFIKSVQAQSGKRYTVAQADALIAGARRIAIAAGCRPEDDQSDHLSGGSG
jgi:hypothetical protein